LDRKLLENTMRKKYRKSKSYIISAELTSMIKETPVYIAGDAVKDNFESYTQSDNLLLVPMKITDENREGWFAASIPASGNGPADDVIAFVEEVVDMVDIRSREIIYLEELIQERRALQEKNIALREVLAAIEEEKMEIRKQIAGMIEDVLRPAANKLLRKNGTVNMTYYQLLTANLDELAATTGQVLPMSSKLSPRELEICALIKNGASSKDIADALGIALVTVQKHREVIRKKLGLTNKNVNLTTHLRST
jgi:DNA-binding CsgD family transcriptional regulator